MAEYYFALGAADQREVLAYASAQTGRPSFLHEKDLWVVWTLGALYASRLGPLLTFKGGTSLSKAYGVIRRFSEDIDLTYNIRELIPDFTNDQELPASRAQSEKWAKAINERLPGWIATNVIPVLNDALAGDRLRVALEPAGDSLSLRYESLTDGSSYVSPLVKLEFGARSTGEPHTIMPIRCDIDGVVPDVTFPTASPMVLDIGRTFWEKATATHVFCAQRRLRGERFARHWFDLSAISRSDHFPQIIRNRNVADAVAHHKGWFFREKDADGNLIDYLTAVRGHLNIVPTGDARDALAADHAAMVESGILLDDVTPFDVLMQSSKELEDAANRSATT